MEISLCTPSKASGWVWENLWRSDTPQALFDIVDVVKLHKGEIVGWIFTSADGTIKRKSNEKRTPKHVEAKCRDYNGNIRAHMMISEDWTSYPDPPHFFQIPSTAAYLIPTAQIISTHFYIEQVFEKQQGIAMPKMATYRLIDSTTKGKSAEIYSSTETCVFPAHKLSCKNKKLNESMKDKMSKLICILEQRSRSNILKLDCIFVIEETNDGDDSFKIRLHHCKEVLAKATKKSRKHKKTQKYSETHSVISEITNISRGSYRTSKCSGDFCSFNQAEESSLAEMEDEFHFQIDVEAAKARRRHRNVNGVIEAEFDDEVEANVKFQRELIDSAMASNTLTDITSSTQSYKVPLKSVLLARSEMKLLDTSDTFLDTVTVWSKTLQAWYRRTGRALIGQHMTSIPASSGHHIEHAMLQIAEHGAVIDESYLKDVTSNKNADGLNSPKLTKEALGSLELDAVSGKSSPKKTHEGGLQYDLHSKPFHEGQSSSSKHLGRYYSNVSVCEKCYHVYKDLDQLRHQGFKQNLHNRKNAALQAKESMRSYEDIEKVNRFTNQTLHNMRLAVAKVRIERDNQCQPTLGEKKSFLSKEGAPKGILPPLPWHLNKAGMAAEYQQQGGSTFVRNIGAKARHMSLLAEQESMELSQHSGLEEADVLNPNYDWKKNLAVRHPVGVLVKSSSAGNNVSRPSKRDQKENTRGFNSDRLLHPHQRYLASMKRENDPIGTVEGKVRVKGGAKRNMLSRKRKGIGVLPSLGQLDNGNVSMTSFDTSAIVQPRPTSPITYAYVQDKLNYPPTSLQSLRSTNKSVSFSASNSVHNIPHRSEQSICEKYEEEEEEEEKGNNHEEDDEDEDEDEDDEDEIGKEWQPIQIVNFIIEMSSFYFVVLLGWSPFMISDGND